MLNILAGTALGTILVMVIVISVVCFFCSDNAKHKSKRSVIITIGILAIIFVIFNGISIILNNKYVTTPEISTIEIKDIYFDEYVHDNTFKESYIVVDTNDKLNTVSTDKICKGDSNYLVIYTQPKLTPAISSLIGKEKYEYELVLTDPENIPNLSRIHH